jgi:hypothetical protein
MFIVFDIVPETPYVQGVVEGTVQEVLYRFSYVGMSGFLPDRAILFHRFVDVGYGMSGDV